MKIFTSKSKYNLGMTKDNFAPVDIHAIYEKVKKKKLAEEIAKMERTIHNWEYKDGLFRPRLQGVGGHDSGTD